MHSWSERYAMGDRRDALALLDDELEVFSHAGLRALIGDLAGGLVARGNWSGCVFSYRRGGSGSVRHDRRGRARNAFTVLWDCGVLTDVEVLARAEAELARRAAAAGETAANVDRHGVLR